MTCLLGAMACWAWTELWTQSYNSCSCRNPRASCAQTESLKLQRSSARFVKRFPEGQNKRAMMKNDALLSDKYLRLLLHGGSTPCPTRSSPTEHMQVLYGSHSFSPTSHRIFIGIPDARNPLASSARPQNCARRPDPRLYSSPEVLATLSQQATVTRGWYRGQIST